MSDKNKGLLRVSLPLIRQALHLPDGVRITYAIQDWQDIQSESITFLVVGAGLPEVVIGEKIPEVTATLRNEADKTVFLGFHTRDGIG